MSLKDTSRKYDVNLLMGRDLFSEHHQVVSQTSWHITVLDIWLASGGREWHWLNITKVLGVPYWEHRQVSYSLLSNINWDFELIKKIKIRNFAVTLLITRHCTTLTGWDEWQIWWHRKNILDGAVHAGYRMFIKCPWENYYCVKGAGLWWTQIAVGDPVGCLQFSQIPD